MADDPEFVRATAYTLYVFGSLHIIVAAFSLFNLCRALYRWKVHHQPLHTISWVSFFVLVSATARAAERFVWAGDFVKSGVFKVTSTRPATGILLIMAPQAALMAAFAIVLALLMSFGGNTATSSSNVQSTRAGSMSFLGRMSGYFLCFLTFDMGSVIVFTIIAAAVDVPGGTAAEKGTRITIVMVITLAGMVLLAILPIVISVAFVVTIKKLADRLSVFQELSAMNRKRIRGLHIRATVFSFSLIGIALVTVLTSLGIDSFFEIIAAIFLLYFHSRFPRTTRDINMDSVRAPRTESSATTLAESNRATSVVI